MIAVQDFRKNIGSYLNQNSAASSAYSATSLGKAASAHFEALGLDTNSCKVLLMVTLVTDFSHARTALNMIGRCVTASRYVSSWYRAGGKCDLPLPPVSCFVCTVGAFYFTAGAIAPQFTLKMAWSVAVFWPTL